MKRPLKTMARLETSIDSLDPRPYLALEHVESGTGRLLNTAELSEREPSTSGMASVRAGDVVFGKLRPYLAKVYLSDVDLVASTELMCLRPEKDVVPRWLYYVCLSKPVIQWAVATAEGVKMPRTNWEKFRDFSLDVPSAREQRAIADFLDRETARIDALTSSKIRLAASLRTRVVASVQHQFAQCDAAIPLRRLIKRIQTGMTPGGDASTLIDDAGEIEWLTPVDFGSWLDIKLAQRRVQREAVVQRHVPLFQKDSVVIVGIGATAGKVAYLDRSASSNQQVTCLTSNELIRGRLLAWQLYVRQSEIRATAPRTTLPILNNDFLKNLLISVPPLESQGEILRSIDAMASTTRSAVSTLNAQINLLTEHRQALITAAVTGQMDTPSAA